MIPGDAEGDDVFNLHSRKQLVDLLTDEILEENIMEP
jgi:hypothetical protein